MSIGEKIGAVVGTVLGTVIGGPVGAAAGPAVGSAIGGAIEDALDGQQVETSAPAAPPSAPGPKPLIASKSAWLGLALAIVPAALQWGVDYDWTQVVNPTVGAVVAGICFIGLRIVTNAPIGPRA